MRNSQKRSGNKGRTSRPPRAPERNCITDGVYSNNFFMHAATSHVGTVVKVETVQGSTYEGVFKTFSHEFDVVLELAHKVDVKDPQKLNAAEVVDNLIFQAKDIVYMCAQNIEPDYAFNTSTFQTDSCISKFNGEISGEKVLQPWEGPPTCNGEEYDLEGNDTNPANGWDVQEMFNANEKFGVQTSYDDTLSDYTCPINRKDTKDFKEDEAKAARIAMEIERNPSSQARSALENGENEEDMFAAVSRPGNEGDGTKYVPPAKRNSSQHHRGGGGGRGNYSANGSQRSSYSIPESPGRPPKSNATTLPRYHHQTSQPYHQPAYGGHPPPLRDPGSRTSPENKSGGQPQMCPSTVPPPQNVTSYSGSVHQPRSYPPNVIPPPAGAAAVVTNHAQSIQIQQQSKSQRTSPISVSAIANGSADYQPKSLPPVTQSPPHQYQNQQQSQQAQSNSNGVANNVQQRNKHHQQPHHHHSNTRVREDQINELKRFGSEFNLSYDMKNKDQDAPKPIQVVTSRNKSPPVSQQPQQPGVAVTIVPTLPPNKYSGSAPVAAAVTQQQPMMAAPPAAATTPTQQQPPMTVPVTAGGQPATQVAMKPHPLVMPQPAPPFAQPLHLQQRDQQVLLAQHQSHMQQQQQMAQTAAPPPPPPHSAHHAQSMQPPPPQQQQQQPPVMQQKMPPQKPVHQMPLLAPMAQQPQAQTVQIQQHPAAGGPQQAKTVITASVPNVAPASAQPPSVATQAGPPPGGNAQGCILPHNVHQRPPLQQQQSLKGQAAPPPPPSTPLSPPPGDLHSETDGKSKDGEGAVDDVSLRVKNVRLNPDAKEYVPTVKSFTPASRSPSTPTQSRPHTPQTPSSYIHPPNAPVAAGIQMVMPTYVVAASPSYVPSQQASSRIRKVPVSSHRTPEFHPSNIPVSAVTGQPLLAPSVTLAPSPLGHGTSYPVPAYAHHPQLAAAQHYPHVQMIRMVQQGGMLPLVPSTISYHDTSGSNATAVYVNHGSGAVAMAPHTQHVHHQQQHPSPSTAPSPSQTPQGPSQSHTPNSYQHPPLTAQNAPPYPSIVCPVIQAPPTHGPPHHMVAAQAQQHAAMQQYIQHPPGMPLYR